MAWSCGEETARLRREGRSSNQTRDKEKERQTEVEMGTLRDSRFAKDRFHPEGSSRQCSERENSEDFE